MLLSVHFIKVPIYYFFLISSYLTKLSCTFWFSVFRDTLYDLSSWWKNPVLWVGWKSEGECFSDFTLLNNLLEVIIAYVILSWLQVFSWEPIICHDAVEMEWCTLADLCIYEGKLFGCSYRQSCIGVWIADITVSPDLSKFSWNFQFFL